MLHPLQGEDGHEAGKTSTSDLRRVSASSTRGIGRLSIRSSLGSGARAGGRLGTRASRGGGCSQRSAHGYVNDGEGLPEEMALPAAFVALATAPDTAEAAAEAAEDTPPAAPWKFV
jgi:hypothetical protein